MEKWWDEIGENFLIKYWDDFAGKLNWKWNKKLWDEFSKKSVGKIKKCWNFRKQKVWKQIKRGGAKIWIICQKGRSLKIWKVKNWIICQKGGA